MNNFDLNILRGKICITQAFGDSTCGKSSDLIERVQDLQGTLNASLNFPDWLSYLGSSSRTYNLTFPLKTIGKLYDTVRSISWEIDQDEKMVFLFRQIPDFFTDSKLNAACKILNATQVAVDAFAGKIDVCFTSVVKAAVPDVDALRAQLESSDETEANAAMQTLIQELTTAAAKMTPEEAEEKFAVANNCVSKTTIALRDALNDQFSALKGLVPEKLLNDVKEAWNVFAKAMNSDADLPEDDADMDDAPDAEAR